MTTTVSIDLVGAASGANTVTSLGEAASGRLSEVNASVNAAAGRDRGSDFQVASEDAVSLFQKTLAAQTAENAALDETMRAALVSVSETLTQVDAAAGREGGSDFQVASIETTAKSPVAVVSEPLPQQIASNATLGTELTTATAAVIETLTALGIADSAEVATGTSTEATGTSLPLSQPSAASEGELSQSSSVNAAAAEAQTSVNAAAAEAQTSVNAAVGREGGSDFQVASIETTAKSPVAVVSEPLPQQIASNATLGTELTAATAAVSETLTALGIAGSAEVATGTSTEATRTSLPLSQPSAASEGELSQSSSVNAAAAEAQTSVNAAAGRERGSDFQVASVESPETSEIVDTPEASADALVAAGVAPQVTTPVTGVETSVLQAVAAVDAVAAKASTPSADVLIQAASAVADTLLVSPGLLRGQGEVLVQLRPDVLDGTEVKISVIGRQLEVVFQPQTVDMAVLIENCRTQLTQHLAAKIASFNVSVDVRKKRG